MKLFNVTCAKPALAFHERKEPFKNLRMALNDSRNQLWISICCIVRNVRRINSAFDQSLGNPAVERVNALDDSGFDSPFPRKFSIEILDALIVYDAFLFPNPNLAKRFKLAVSH